MGQLYQQWASHPYHQKPIKKILSDNKCYWLQLSWSCTCQCYTNQNRADQRRHLGNRFPDNGRLTVVCHEVGTVYSIWQAFLFNSNLQNRRTLLINLGEQKQKLGDCELQVAHEGMSLTQMTCSLLLAHDLSFVIASLSHLFN